MKLGAPALIFAIGASCNAAAAQDMDQRRFQAFLFSDFGKSLTTRALAMVPQSVLQKCPTLAPSTSKVVVLRPVSFAASGFPNAGAWKQEVPVRGCGDDLTLNIYYSAGPDEKVQTLIGAPGATRADPTLQRDAFTYATASIGLISPGCAGYSIKNTRFQGFGYPSPSVADPGPGARYRPWWEVWTMVGCGRTFDVPIDFQPWEGGTRIIQPNGILKQ